MTSPGVAPAGHGTPSACAESRSRSTSRGSASGSVRTMPMRPSSMSRAAHMPVSSEICAFHSSTGRVARLPRVHTPSAPCSTTCSGVGSVMPPRARSAASRRMPTSRSSCSVSSAVPSSRAACAPTYVSCARLCTEARRTSTSTGAPSRVEVDRPQQRRRHLVGQQARDALRQQRRVQRRAAVRGVERLDAVARLVVESAARATPTRRRRRSRTAPGTRRRGARCGPPGPGPSSPRGRW